MEHSILKPSEILQYAVDGTVEEASDLQLTDILDGESTKDPITEDEAILQSADASTKEGIEHLKSDMTKEEELIPPVINVNVESNPLQVTREKSSDSKTFISKENSTNTIEQDNSNPSEYITNTYITNIESKEKVDPTNKAGSTPSEIAQTEADDELKVSESDEAAEVKIVSDGTPIPVELVRDQTKEPEIKAIDIDSNKDPAVTPEIITKEVTKTNETNIQSVGEQPLVVDETFPIKDDHDVRVATEESSDLSNILDGNAKIDEITQRQENIWVPPDYSLTKKLETTPSIDPANILIAETKKYDGLPEDNAKLIHEKTSDYYKEFAKIENSENNKSVEIVTKTIVDAVAQPLADLSEGLPDGIVKLTESVVENTKTVDEQTSQFNLFKETPIVATDKSRVDGTSDNVSNLAEEARVQQADSKLSADLTKSILLTPEAKQLTSVNENLSQVKGALEQVSEAQVTNNKIITTNTNNTNSTNLPTEQILTPDEPNSTTEVQKEEVKPSSVNSNENSEYLLQAIYDALVSTGIKIKTF